MLVQAVQSSNIGVILIVILANGTLRGRGSYRVPRGPYMGLFNFFWTPQNHRKTILNPPNDTQFTLKWCQNVVQDGSFHGTKGGVCGSPSDGVTKLFLFFDCINIVFPSWGPSEPHRSPPCPGQNQVLLGSFHGS